MLSVYLTPDGWALDGRDFKIPIPEWIDRTDRESDGLTLTGYRSGAWVANHPGSIAGIDDLLPLEIDTWARDERFELGCNHGHGLERLENLAEDCRKFRESRALIARAIDWIG